MRIKKIVALLVGLTGASMIFYSLAQGTVTGAVIGTNIASRFLGVFGILLMIVAIVIERHEVKK